MMHAFSDTIKYTIEKPKKHHKLDELVTRCTLYMVRLFKQRFFNLPNVIRNRATHENLSTVAIELAF